MKKFLSVLVLLLSMTFVSATESPKWDSQPIYVNIPQAGRYSKLMMQAFKEWEYKSNYLVRFKFLSRPSSANIVVNFVDHVTNCGSKNAVGCARMSIVGGEFYSAQLDIAMKSLNSNNEYRPIENIYGVMLHEIGHALGLAHSNDPNSIMYSYDLPTLQYLTKTDLNLLYNKYH